MSEIRTRQQGDTPFFPNMLNNGSVEVCLKEDVDKVISEKDKEIAILKERICNGDVSRSTWIDDCFDKDKEIEELKKKLEDVQASMYADVVDANMEVSRLRRALWLARASEASKEVNYWICQDETSYTLVDFNVRHETITSFKSLYHRPHEWILIWENVERKCRAKAEEYK